MLQCSVAFGGFELHPKAAVLLNDSAPVPLGGRAFELLCTLVEHRDRMLSKSELLDVVWPGLVVEENNLSVQISTLRRLLGKSAISTITGRGYRFALPAAEISPLRDAKASAAATSTHGSVIAPMRPYTGGTPIDEWRWAEMGVLLAVIADAGAAQPDSAPRHAAATEALVPQRLGFVADAVGRCGGILLASPSASVLAEFNSARAAMACVRSLRAATEPSECGTSWPVRMALVRCHHAQSDPVTRSAMACVAPDDPSIIEIQSAFELARTAPPGELRASAWVRDQLTDGLDCRVEDLGELRFSDKDTALRSYRIEPAPAAAEVQRQPDARDLKPVIAVLPFESRQAAATSLAIGELLADGMITVLSHSRHPWRVVSRLSATAFRGRESTLAELKYSLAATFVVSGSYVEQNDRLWVTLQVVDCRSGDVAVARRMDGTVADLLGPHSSLLDAMLGEIQRAVYEIELQRVQSAPVPTLHSYTLLLGGIQLLHRSSPRDFDLSFRVFDQLVQWHPQALEPRVWQAKWYAMRAVQGLSQDLLGDAKAALACTGATLTVDPNHAFALAMEGFVHAHLTRDYALARERLQQSIQRNHSETFAHLFHGVVQGLTGDFVGGLESYAIALSTSPQDPARYLMDTIGAYLNLGCGQLESAIRLARESLRQNRNHAHSWRTITIAQHESGAREEARDSLRHVLQLQPDLTVTRYLAGARPNDPVRHRFAMALHGAGLPLH